MTEQTGVGVQLRHSVARKAKDVLQHLPQHEIDIAGLLGRNGEFARHRFSALASELAADKFA